jgi:hypothetical protein
MKSMELKANLGFVVRGDFTGLNLFADLIDKLALQAGVQIVHKQVSASRLWIKEGDEMNERTREV